MSDDALPSTGNILTVATVRAEPCQPGRFTVRGELDHCTAFDFETAMLDLLATRMPQVAGNRSICLDLGGVTFLDLGGIAVLEDFQSQVHALGGDLDVIKPAAQEPCHLLRFAVDRGWLVSEFIEMRWAARGSNPEPAD